MQKKSSVIFLVFCFISFIFYTIAGPSFGKSIVRLGGMAGLLLTILFAIFLFSNKKIPSVICVIALLFLQLPILYCWTFIVSEVYVGSFLKFLLSSAFGIVFHILTFILGIVTICKIGKCGIHQVRQRNSSFASAR